MYKVVRLTSRQVQRRDPTLDLDLRMRRLAPRVPEPYPLVEMAAHDCRADGLGRNQVVATGSGELRLDAYAARNINDIRIRLFIIRRERLRGSNE